MKALISILLLISSLAVADSRTLSKEDLIGTWEHSYTNMQGLSYVQLVIGPNLSSRYINIDPKAEYELVSKATSFKADGSIYTFIYEVDEKLVSKLVVSGWKSSYSGHKLLFGHLFHYQGDESKLYTGIPVQLVPENAEPLWKRLERLKEVFNNESKGMQ